MVQLKRVVTKGWNGIIAVLGMIVMTLLLGLVGIVFLEVIFRYILLQPLVWSLEISESIFVAIIFLYAAKCTLQRSHITIEVLDVVVRGEKARSLVNIVADFLCIGVSIFLTIWTYEALQFLIGSGSTLGFSKHAPKFVPMIFVFIGSVVMLVAFVVTFIGGISRLRKTPG